MIHTKQHFANTCIDYGIHIKGNNNNDISFIDGSDFYRKTNLTYRLYRNWQEQTIHAWEKANRRSLFDVLKSKPRFVKIKELGGGDAISQYYQVAHRESTFALFADFYKKPEKGHRWSFHLDHVGILACGDEGIWVSNYLQERGLHLDRIWTPEENAYDRLE